MIITNTTRVPRRPMADMIWFLQDMMVPFSPARCTLRCGSLIRARVRSVVWDWNWNPVCRAMKVQTPNWWISHGGSGSAQS
ncbi:hypothetical protein GCM10011326_42770 [Salipiger profundus]|uniref:Uncharacterized protein n=1 Tax=Salipiger pallidus TaxID=1775170 RepID=A0A8J2ZNL0_9RHOB|nr:hypothetical protein GCM10011326_42770 [Salipiger profundus]GGG86185.1 hypothetical protein GCM10011415_40740 [Salipiger pallidus]